MPSDYGIERAGTDRFHVEIAEYEHRLLLSIAEQVRPFVAGDADVADAARRLYPAAYDGAIEEQEYRELIGSSLVSERVRAFDRFSETLARGSSDTESWTVELDSTELDAWRSALQDAIVVLAAVLGIPADAREYTIDATDPNSVALEIVQVLQNDVVGALMSTLPD